MKFKVQSSKFKVRFIDKLSVSALVLFSFISGLSCSIPNLEQPECTESRAMVKQFYSKHFGGDLKPDFEKLQQLKDYLSPRLFEELKNQKQNDEDYFTQTNDYPKAFRVGGCEVVSENKSVLEILLFWKTETRSEQREIKIETVKENDKWLIEKVENKK